MKVSGQNKWTDYYQAQLLHIRPPLWAKIVIFLFIGILVYGEVIIALSSEFQLLYVINCVILVVILLLIRYVYIPWRVRRSYDQHKELNVPWEIVITETSLEISNEYGHAIRPWSDFIKWREDDQLLLLYESPSLYRVIPKRFFDNSEQFSAIRQKLIDNHVPATSGPTGCAVVSLLILILMIAMFYLRSTV